MYFLRSIFSAAIIAIVVIIFRIGFVYSADEIFEKFRLRQFLNPDYSEEIYDKYDSFTEKRKNQVIDTDRINEKIEEGKDDILRRLDEKIDEEINRDSGQ